MDSVERIEGRHGGGNASSRVARGMRRRSEVVAGAVIPDTLVASGSHPATGTVRAMYLTGPNGGARHILPQGLVSLGRDSKSTIVVDDPRVSRAHLALHVSETMTVTDLGSANGTFLERRRLAPHEPTELVLEASFSMGDTTFVVRPTSLVRSCLRHVTTWEEVRARLAKVVSAHGPGARVALVRIQGLRTGGAETVEAILGELLESPHDWLMRSAANEVSLGMEVDLAIDEARTLQRAISQRLATWNLRAEVEATIVSADELAKAPGDLRALLAREAPVKLNRGAVVFQAPSMIALKRTLMRIAPATVNVLVLGETGAGKDVVASLLHVLSPRASKRFVVFNCANFPESLLETELFGHERGAFTGAATSKQGLLETADGGTVFLDEIGELPLSMQAKLLRVIESREVTRIGGLAPRPIDLRFVAATNRDLDVEVNAGRFRRDLFFRLNTVTVAVPPLRERRSEIEPLARLFLANAAARFDRPALDFAPGSIEALEAHDWPGNVRELRNVIEQAALLATGDLIEPADLSFAAAATDPEEEPAPMSIAGGTLSGASDRDEDRVVGERERIERALTDSAGNQSRAAEALGIPRRTLVRKIARLGIPRPRR